MKNLPVQEKQHILNQIVNMLNSAAKLDILTWESVGIGCFVAVVVSSRTAIKRTSWMRFRAEVGWLLLFFSMVTSEITAAIS